MCCWFLYKQMNTTHSDLSLIATQNQIVYMHSRARAFVCVPNLLYWCAITEKMMSEEFVLLSTKSRSEGPHIQKNVFHQRFPEWFYEIDNIIIPQRPTAIPGLFFSIKKLSLLFLTHQSTVDCSVCLFVCLIRSIFLENLHIILSCFIENNVRFQSFVCFDRTIFVRSKTHKRLKER